jgi:tol-pal system protein YbgF
MKPRYLAIACSTLLAVGLAAPAIAAPDKETRQMMSDIRMLQEQGQQLQNLIGQLTETLKTIDTRLNTKIDDQANALRKSLADQKLVVDSVSRDIGVLREKVDETSVRLGSLGQEVDALRELVTQINTRTTYVPFPADDPTAIAPTTTDPSAPSASAPTAAPIPAPAPQVANTPAAAAGASPKRMFEAAQADYYGGNFALAITSLDGFLKSFPKAQEAAEAQLLIGHSYLNDRQYDKALEAYDATIRNYPTSNWVREAYYKKGLSLQSLGREDEAREAFNVVVQKYADSPEAGLASQRLASMKPQAATQGARD